LLVSRDVGSTSHITGRRSVCGHKARGRHPIDDSSDDDDGNHGSSNTLLNEETVVFDRIHYTPAPIQNDPTGFTGSSIQYNSQTGQFTIARKGVYLFDGSASGRFQSKGESVELRWLVPNAFDPTPNNPFGVTDSTRVHSVSRSSVPGFTTATVRVTSVPSVFSLVGEADRSFVKFDDAWARVSLLYAL